MADDDLGMYDVEEDDEQVTQPGSNSVVVNRLPMTTELKINDKVVVTVNPEYVTAMQRRMVQMESRMRMLEEDLRSLRNTLRNKEVMMERLKSLISEQQDFE